MNLEQKYDIDSLLNSVEDESIDVDEEIDYDELENEETNKRKLYVDKSDKSTSDIFRMIVEKELNLQPDYQRKFVWDKKTMSKFIESLLLSIPTPTIFLAENYDESFEVIDGQQRLTTIFSFMKSRISETEANLLPDSLKNMEVLTLTGLETLRQFNKTNYDTMDESKKRKFNNVSLPIVVIKKDSSEDVKYDIFSRINSGSIKLNKQELLNVMYRGELISSLNRVAESEIVDMLFGYRPVLKKRFGYHEILLRIMAMECFIDNNSWKLKEVDVKNIDILGKNKKKYNGRLNDAVIDYLKEYRNDIDESKRLEKFLFESIEKVNMVFGDKAFIRVDKNKSTKINKNVAELQMITLSRFNKSIIENNVELIKDSFNRFLETQDENIFLRATNNTTNIEKRYEWGRVLSKELEGK